MFGVVVGVEPAVVDLVDSILEGLSVKVVDFVEAAAAGFDDSILGGSLVKVVGVVELVVAELDDAIQENSLGGVVEAGFDLDVDVEPGLGQEASFLQRSYKRLVFGPKGVVFLRF